jgi:hypothetical protein
MVCKKNTGDLYWFGPRSALRGGGEFYIILHQSACSRGYKRMWERDELPSLKVREERVCVWLCWRPRKIQESYLLVSRFVLLLLFFFFSSSWNDPYMLLL